MPHPIAPHVKQYLNNFIELLNNMENDLMSTYELQRRKGESAKHFNDRLTMLVNRQSWIFGKSERIIEFVNDIVELVEEYDQKHVEGVKDGKTSAYS